MWNVPSRTIRDGWGEYGVRYGWKMIKDYERGGCSGNVYDNGDGSYEKGGEEQLYSGWIGSLELDYGTNLFY